jgi:hypothetical protein
MMVFGKQQNYAANLPSAALIFILVLVFALSKTQSCLDVDALFFHQVCAQYCVCAYASLWEEE